MPKKGLVYLVKQLERYKRAQKETPTAFLSAASDQRFMPCSYSSVPGAATDEELDNDALSCSSE